MPTPEQPRCDCGRDIVAGWRDGSFRRIDSETVAILQFSEDEFRADTVRCPTCKATWRLTVLDEPGGRETVRTIQRVEATK